MQTVTELSSKGAMQAKLVRWLGNPGFSGLRPHNSLGRVHLAGQTLGRIT